MAYISVIKTNNQEVLIGYAFFLIVIRPIFDLSGKLIYYKIVRKVKVVKILEVKVKALISKSRKLNISSNDLLNLFKFLSILPVLFFPIQRIYLKIGLKVYKIGFLVFFRVGFFSYNLMLSYCPLFLVIYSKLYSKFFSHKFLKRLFQKLKLLLNGDYDFDDEKLFLLDLVGYALAIYSLFLSSIVFALLIYGAKTIGQEYAFVLKDFKELKNSIRKSRNLFDLLKNLFYVLKKQILIRIEVERTFWKLTTNNFSKVCRLASWFVYILFVVSYAKSFKDFKLKPTNC